MMDTTFQLVASFGIGVLSSLIAAWLIIFKGRSRYNLSFPKVLSLIDDLQKEIKSDGFQYDHIVCLGRNSGVIGSILAGSVNQNSIISVSMVKSRLPNGERTIEFDKFSEDNFPKLAGCNILLLLCCNDSGASLKYGFERISSCNPKELKTAALYSMPSPLFKPDYISVVVGVNTKRTMTEILEGLPWTRGRWIHPFGSERRDAT